MIFEGAISVKAILEEQKRHIHKVYLQEQKKSKNLSYIVHLCHKHQVDFEFVSKQIIDNLASGQTHGGILVDADSKRSEELNVNEDFYLYLEGIEDPFNIGQIIRTAAIAGVKTVLLSNRDYTNLEPTLLKSSAGTYEKIKIVICDTELTNLVQLKQNKVKIISALRSDDSVDLYQANLKDPLCLCVGGEKRGLSKRATELSDQFVEIHYPTDFRVALGASSSSSILLFEVVRQRLEK